MLLHKITVGTRLVTNGILLRLTEDLGGGAFLYETEQPAGMSGEIFFTEESEEGNDLFVIGG